nr:tripartite tricarboxylate transporter substrate binding protein [Ramlibacter paludis]
MPRRQLTACAAALALFTLAGTARAEAWPDKPIRFIVPYTPGGGTDTVTRHIADRIAQDSKWAFLVDNKPGGGGNIGLDIVAKAKPDGYTIGMGQTANIAINPAALPKMPFDPAKDLVPVALVAEVPMVLVVPANSPLKSLADLVKAAKAKPGGMNQALAATGTVGHLAGEMLGRKAGFKVMNIPYKGAAPALAEMIGGQTDFMFATPQAVMGLLAGGKLRALAITSSKRVPALGSVPTVAEQGYPGFEATDWKVIVAPAGTPTDVIQRLNAATAKALAEPGLVAKLAEEGSVPMSGNPAAVLKYIRDEQKEWGALIREAGIRFE